MDTLKSTVEKEIAKYAVDGLNSTSHLMINADHTAYLILTIAHVRGQQIVNTDLIVRLVGNIVIIDQDLNTKPLVDALTQNGIPRDHIILVYEGEPIPETSHP